MAGTGGNGGIACLTCRHVVENGRPVLFFSHCGGEWIALCGDQRHYDEESTDYMTYVHLAHVLEAHPELAVLLSLPVDRAAERESPDHPWRFIDDADD